MEERGGVALLRFDVHRLVPVHRIHDDRAVQPGGIGAREAGVAIAGPLHRRPHAVAVPEIEIVTHPDLVAVVDDRRAREREEQADQQLDAGPAVADERRQAPANADVEPRLRVHAVRQIHVVALVVGDHLERQLVVVPQKERPLAAVRNGGRLLHHVDDRLSILEVQRHEDARHDREVVRHVAFVAVTEVSPHVGRQLIGLGQQHAGREPARRCARGLP